MVLVESADGKKKDIDCIGCAIVRGEIESVGGSIAGTDNFDAHQDYEIPIPGFVILASKKHVKGLEDFSKAERVELIEFLYRIRKAMKDTLGIEYVDIIQEESTIKKFAHFHVWLFPRYEWMDEIGEGVESVRRIMEYARGNMKTEHNLDEVKKAAEKLKEYLSG